MIKNVTWLTSERTIAELSLGGLTIAVFAKTLYTNMIKTRVSIVFTTANNQIRFLSLRTATYTQIASQLSQTCRRLSNISRRL